MVHFLKLKIQHLVDNKLPLVEFTKHKTCIISRLTKQNLNRTKIELNYFIKGRNPLNKSNNYVDKSLDEALQ